jgi:hypothetical protein
VISDLFVIFCILIGYEWHSYACLGRLFLYERGVLIYFKTLESRLLREYFAPVRRTIEEGPK